MEPMLAEYWRYTAYIYIYIYIYIICTYYRMSTILYIYIYIYILPNVDDLVSLRSMHVGSNSARLVLFSTKLILADVSTVMYSLLTRYNYASTDMSSKDSRARARSP